MKQKFLNYDPNEKIDKDTTTDKTEKYSRDQWNKNAMNYKK